MAKKRVREWRDVYGGPQVAHFDKNNLQALLSRLDQIREPKMISAVEDGTVPSVELVAQLAYKHFSEVGSHKKTSA